jgi:hypothetical protein
MNKNLNELLDKALDSVDCNQKEKDVTKCFQDLDSRIFFKRRKYSQCLTLQKQFQHCLVYANQNSLNKRENFRGEINRLELDIKYEAIRSENKKDAINFMQGNLREEDLLNKPENPQARKKIIEL